MERKNSTAFDDMRHSSDEEKMLQNVLFGSILDTAGESPFVVQKL